MSAPEPRLFVIFNPKAGRADPQWLRQALEQQAAAYHVHELSGGERISEVMGRALEQEFNLIAAAGGDGTVSSVAGGLVHTDVSLGIIPMGTGNILARNLSIPLELDQALALLTGPSAVRQIDAIQVGDDFFVTNLGVGFSALTMRDTEGQQKRRFGLAAYLWTGLKQLLGFQPQRFRLATAHQKLDLQAAEVFVANGKLLSLPFLRLEQDIRLDDGQLDVFVVRARTALDYLRLATGLLLTRSKGAPNVRYLSVSDRIHIDAHRPLPVQADGDIIGQTPIWVEVAPGALRVVVPPD